MKDEKVKLIIAVIVFALAIVGTFIIFNKKKEEYKDVDDNTKEKINNVLGYYTDITRYYSSKFDGVDLLFDKDKTTLDDISVSSMLRLATVYTAKNLNSNISNTLINQLINTEGLNQDSYTFYEGKNIRTAIKELFGVDFKDQSILNNKDFKYNYQYFKDYDVYAVSSNDYANNDSYQVDYKVLSTKENKDGNIKVEIAIAYVFIDNSHNTLKYSSKSDLSDLIYEVKIDDAGIKEEDKFTKYNLFLKKDGERFIFDKLEKIK